PNPCIRCNDWLKFGRLHEYAARLGCDFIASGHYARIGRDGEESTPRLLRAVDHSKDQSYVLFGIDRDLLDRILFPVGDYDKTEIRALARETGLRVADKPDSQEICFIPDNDYAAFIERYRGAGDTTGEMVDTAGRVVGRHAGYERFTVGQRKGLRVTFGSPRFVVAIEPQSKRVVIGTKEDLSRTELEADRLNWLIPDVPAQFDCQAQIRYRHQPAAAEVRVLDDDRLRVRFEGPQYGVAPGQAVVFYEDDRVLGGGWIR
ncbi:MAG: tRNA 2-thiouridine(34) synthase MnmA, partial [Planctomycetaceae bacterium]